MSDIELTQSEINAGFDEIELEVRNRQNRLERLRAMSTEELNAAAAAVAAEQESLYTQATEVTTGGIVEPEDIPKFMELERDMKDIGLARTTKILGLPPQPEV